MVMPYTAYSDTIIFTCNTNLIIMSTPSLSIDKTEKEKDPVTLLEELALQQKTPVPSYQLEIERDFDSKLYFKIM